LIYSWCLLFSSYNDIFCIGVTHGSVCYYCAVVFFPSFFVLLYLSSLFF